MARVRIALFARMLPASLILAALMLTSFGIAQAQDAQPPSGLLIYNAWVRPTAPALADRATPEVTATEVVTPEAPLPGTVTGAYMTIANTSSSDYQLVGVADDLAEMSMLHEMTIDSKGVARMQMIPSLDIPAGQTVTLGAEGDHVMLMNVTHDIYPGQAVALTLTFKDGSGATSDILVGAIASDDPPANDPLTVANALAQPDAADAQTLDVALILDNHGDQGDTLTSAASDAAATVQLMHSDQAGIMPFDAIYAPPQTQTTLSTDTAFIRVSKLAQPVGEAFALTLTFQSGKTITIGVPVKKAAS